MKNKYYYVAALLVGSLIAADPQPAKPEDPLVNAREAVNQRIVLPHTDRTRPFSRVGPISPSIQYLEPQIVDGEKRLPFKVRIPRTVKMQECFVRLSDNEIFVIDANTRKLIPLAKHPDFVPNTKLTDFRVLPNVQVSPGKGT